MHGEYMVLKRDEHVWQRYVIYYTPKGTMNAEGWCNLEEFITVTQIVQHLSD